MRELVYLLAESILWLVSQLREHKLSWFRALLMVGPATLFGGVTGWLLTSATFFAGFFACIGFVIGVGILYVIAKKRQLEHDWEWTKYVEPMDSPDSLSDLRRH